MIDSKEVLRVADAIIARGLAKSYAEICRTIGVRRNYFYDIKIGACKLSGDVASRLCTVYGVNTTFISTGSGYMFSDIRTLDEDNRILREKIATLTSELASLQKKYIALLEKNTKSLNQ